MKINTKNFGKGRAVSTFTLGTMRAVESSSQMYEVVKSAIAAGINHIETAPSYGPAETLLGKVLKKLQQEDLIPSGGWVITSKFLPGVDLATGKSQIKELLNRLGLKKIDNLAIHGLNLPEHLEWATIGAGAEILRWAKNKNLINQVGFSSHGAIPLIQDAINTENFDFCSLHLHLFDQARIPLALYALELGMGVMAISPADKGGHLHSPSKTLINDCYPIQPLEIAYRFLLSKGINTLTVGATKSSDLELAKKLINQNGPLNENEKRIIENIQKNSAQRLEGTNCGQCKQCLPCPQAVPIPDLLRLRNLAIGHDLIGFARERYNLIGKAGHWWESIDASRCLNCGDCLPKCPNNLDIPLLLSETHKLLVDKPKRRLWG